VTDTGRLETFADGVFAIAITLLVLAIRLPTPTEDVPKLDRMSLRTTPLWVRMSGPFEPSPG